MADTSAARPQRIPLAVRVEVSYRNGFEVGAETVDPHEPAGIGLVADALSRMLGAAATHGSLLEFDGHRTDPHLHLHPILAALPHHDANPLDLVEDHRSR